MKNQDHISLKGTEKIFNAISLFTGMKLKNARLRTEHFEALDQILLLELEFENEHDKRTMVLALDRDLTESESELIYEKMVK